MTLAEADQILDRGDDSPQPPALWLIKKSGQIGLIKLLLNGILVTLHQQCI